LIFWSRFSVCSERHPPHICGRKKQNQLPTSFALIAIPFLFFFLVVKVVRQLGKCGWGRRRNPDDILGSRWPGTTHSFAKNGRFSGSRPVPALVRSRGPVARLFFLPGLPAVCGRDGIPAHRVGVCAFVAQDRSVPPYYAFEAKPFSGGDRDGQRYSPPWLGCGCFFGFSTFSQASGFCTASPSGTSRATDRAEGRSGRVFTRRAS